MASTIRTTSPYLDTPTGSSGSGLDQVLGWIASDGGLAGANQASSIAAGLAAVDDLNRLLIEGLAAIGVLQKAVLEVADVILLNAWVREDSHPERLALFTTLHGDDEGGIETGYHTIQGDGGNRQFDGKALIDTVLDGVYHFGFALNADSTRFTNEDGADNAALSDVARWLTALKTDLATSQTGLDRIVETIVADPGLQAAIPWVDLQAGASAADGLNQLIVAGIAALQQNGAADSDTSRLSVTELGWINSWIRSDAQRLASFVALHGDDENGSETGYHLVQNDGATTRLFGKNAVNTIYDGIYHIGFTINGDGRFQNEDGNANAQVSDVAEWITYYYGDPSTAGTGLDRLVDWIKLDQGLARNTAGKDINDGLAAANGLNQLYGEAIDTTGVNADGLLSRADLRAISQWIRENRYDAFVLLHGDDEGDGTETGFHLIQNDGGSTRFFGQNLVNTVADGLFHIGFEIQSENFVNEDGNTNQSLSDVSGWLNYFVNDIRLTTGTGDADTLIGNDGADQFVAYGGHDLLQGEGGADLLDGGWGRDSLLGGSGSDQLDGGFDNDLLDGGADADTYLVSGAGPQWIAGQPYRFQGYDSYGDSGNSGLDRILAEGIGPVDIGLLNFGPASGIEAIVNATSIDDGAGGTTAAEVRLLGDWQANILDFSATTFSGGSFQIDGAGGKDSITGSGLDDRIRGGGDNDWLNGGAGGDRYEVSGAGPDWIDGQPYLFEGYDSYADTGADGNDHLVAVGHGPVDVGLLNFGPASGIEAIVNATSIDDGAGGAMAAEVRLLGNWEANTFDFSATELRGGSIRMELKDGNDRFLGSTAADQVDGGYGNDSLQAGAGDDILIGAGGDDSLDGGQGSDTYRVSGLVAGGWKSFGGYDTYTDSGLSGIDRIVAVGIDDVDIGLAGGNFLASNGIDEIVNASSKVVNSVTEAGRVRLLGNWQNNSLDFHNIAFVGGNFRIESGDGSDSIIGSAAADTLLAGKGDDSVNGAGGNDIYEVSGNSTTGFHGYDVYADSGSGDFDQILVVAAVGSEAVDIGLRSFGLSSGIEQINATATSGRVRLLGDSSANLYDFTAVTLVGSNLSIDVGSGNDTVIGSAAADRILAGTGTDSLNGAAGSDTYEVSGNSASGFGGYDIYADSGSGVAEIDRIVVANGTMAVDIGLTNFASSHGIEEIDATASSGQVRLLGNSSANSFNFTGITLVGSNLSIDVGSGNDTVIGSVGADNILGGLGVDQLNGADGDDIINGGGGLDRLTGGSGNDTFDYTKLTDAIIGGTSSAPLFETIIGFTVGADRFDLTTTPVAGSFKTLGSASALTVAAISSLLSSSSFQANGSATFSYGSGANLRNFIAFNDGTAGYKSSTDAIVEISSFGFATGYDSLAQIGFI